MSGRRESIWRILGFLTGICIVLLLVLQPWHHPERSRPPSPDKTPGGPSLPPSGQSPRQIHSPGTTPAGDSVVRFGILGPPTDGAAEWHYPLSVALKCIKASGCPCEVVAPPGADLPSLRTLLRTEDIVAEARSFESAMERLSALLVLSDADLDDTSVSKLKGFVRSGGWLIVSSNPKLVKEVAGLPAGDISDLYRMWHSTGKTESSFARFLVGHPILPRPRTPGWFPIPVLVGRMELSRLTVGLWLIAFRNPSSAGLTILSAGTGGIVETNWQACEVCDLDRFGSGTIFRNAVAWLARKHAWRTPADIPSQVVTGRVVDEDDSPIAGAEVMARVFADWGAQLGERKATTDQDGNFSMTAMAPSIYWFEASAENMSQEDPFVMARCEEGSEQEPVTIVLRRTVALSGTVYYEGRETAPAPDFPVTLLPTDRDPEIENQTTVSDQQGQFAFERVPFGKTYLVLSEKGEWGGWKVVELPLSPSEKPERVALAIERVPLVHGRVVEYQTYKPIPGARVMICVEGSDHTLKLFCERLARFEKCDEEKGFSFHLLPGHWWVEGKAENHHQMSAREGNDYKSLSWVRMKVASGKTDPESPLLFQLQSFKPWTKTQFYGTVYLPSGEPAANAFIWTWSRDLTRSDSEGKYETGPVSCTGAQAIDGVRLCEFSFEVRCQSFVAFPSLLLPELPRRHHLDLYLEPGEAARGFVRDTKGNPVEGARVTMVSRDEIRGTRVHQQTSEAVLSEADGSFTLPGVASVSEPRKAWYQREIVLRAEKVAGAADGHARYVGQAKVILPESGPIRDFDIIIARAGPIRGTISYHDGTPLRNAWSDVVLQCGGDYEEDIGLPGLWSVHLDDHGGFSMEVTGFHQEIDLQAREQGRENWRKPATLPPETYELKVIRSDESDDSTLWARNTLIVKQVQAGMTDLDIRFPAFGTVRARVIDGETGLPIEKFTIYGHERYDTDPWPPGSCWTGEVNLDAQTRDGEFYLRDLFPGPYGTYRLSILCDKYTDRWYMEVPVAANQTTDLGNIPLYRNWWVRGRAVAADTGQPIAATVTGPNDTTTATDRDGYFALAIPGDTLYYRGKVIPVEKTWQEAQIRSSFETGPTVDLGDVVLQPAPPE
ncbi:MAG: carboxypeptidase-like regulatory domain-containing protein [bacterium]|nr:carboxypeptidase-like regulatory domain-containing protein [bacterium]